MFLFNKILAKIFLSWVHKIWFWGVYIVKLHCFKTTTFRNVLAKKLITDKFNSSKKKKGNWIKSKNYQNIVGFRKRKFLAYNTPRLDNIIRMINTHLSQLLKWASFLLQLEIRTALEKYRGMKSNATFILNRYSYLLKKISKTNKRKGIKTKYFRKNISLSWRKILDWNDLLKR